MLDILPFRRMFTMKRGYFGVGPESMLTGDRICVLYGGKVPFVVRWRNNGWLLIGEAYVPGYMSGEPVQEGQDGRLQERTLVLT